MYCVHDWILCTRIYLNQKIYTTKVKKFCPAGVDFFMSLTLAVDNMVGRQAILSVVSDMISHGRSPYLLQIFG